MWESAGVVDRAEIIRSFDGDIEPPGLSDGLGGVKEFAPNCVSTVVARRDPRLAPSWSSRSSCRPTDQPQPMREKLYAMEAMMPVDEVRIDNERGVKILLALRDVINSGDSELSSSVASLSLDGQRYKDSTLFRDSVSKYGEAHETQVIAPLVDGGFVKDWVNRPAAKSKENMVKLPSSKPTVTSISSRDESLEPAASDVGVLYRPSRLSDRLARHSFLLFVDHARNPLLASAVNTILRYNFTNTGGIGGCATSTSLTRQLPLDQLCRRRYCFFQFVPSPPLTRCA